MYLQYRGSKQYDPMRHGVEKNLLSDARNIQYYNTVIDYELFDVIKNAHPDGYGEVVNSA